MLYFLISFFCKLRTHVDFRSGLGYMVSTILIYFLLCCLPLYSQVPQLKITTGHNDNIKAFSISPDGKLIATASVDRLVKIWDFQTGYELKSLAGHTVFVYYVCFSPDGKTLVSASWDSTLKLWDVSTGKLLKTLKGHSGSIYKAIFSPDGKRIYSGGDEDKNLKVWNSSTGELIFNLQANSHSTFDCSPDGKLIVSGSYFNKEAIVFNTSTGKIIKKFTVDENGIHSIAFSPDGTKLLTGIGNGVILWDAKLFTVIKKFDLPKGSKANSVCFSKDGKRFLCGLSQGYTGHIKLYNIETEQEIRPFTGFIDNPNHVSFAENDNLVVSTDKNIVHVWETSTGKEVKQFKKQGGNATDIGNSPDGKNLYIRNDRRVFAWNLSSGTCNELPITLDEWGSIDFSPNNPTLLYSDGSMIKHIDAQNFTEIKSFDAQVKHVWTTKFSPDGSSFFYDAGNNKILSDLTSGNKLQQFNTKLFSLAPNMNFAAGHTYYNLTIFDVATGKVLKDIQTGTILDCIKFSPNSKTVAAGLDMFVYFYSAETGMKTKTFKGHTWSINDIIFTKDGKTMITAGDDHTIKTWNTETAATIKTLTGHLGQVNAIKLSPDEKYLYSSSIDGSLRIWSMATGKEIISLWCFNDKDWLAITPNGQFDGTPEAMRYLYYTKGNTIIPLESYFEQFYTPGLVAQTFEGSSVQKTLPDITNLSLPPDVKFVSPVNGYLSLRPELKLSILATDKGGGVDEIRLYHNGKMVQTTQRGFKAVGQNIEFTIALVDGENKFKVSAFNTQRTESVSNEISVFFKSSQQVKPDMHILAVGINSYLNPKYSLNFAKNDAEAFTQSLQSGAESIFGKVNVTTLSDANATRAGIMAAVDKIKSTAKPEDVFVFYYAGHGVMSSGNETEKPIFYLVPHDVTKMYEADDMLKRLGISANEIGEFSKNIKAQKQLFVIDACQSGGAMQTLAMRGAAEEKAIAQLARSTGTYFIAASGTEQFATEVAELGHGIFTYSVIEALKGSCKAQDGKVTVNLLKSCVEDLVPELSKKHKGQPQFPTGYGFGMDFPIVMIVR